MKTYFLPMETLFSCDGNLLSCCGARSALPTEIFFIPVKDRFLFDTIPAEQVVHILLAFGSETTLLAFQTVKMSCSEIFPHLPPYLFSLAIRNIVQQMIHAVCVSQRTVVHESATISIGNNTLRIDHPYRPGLFRNIARRLMPQTAGSTPAFPVKTKRKIIWNQRIIQFV